MNLEKISKYFEPKRVLDIGANIGQFRTDFLKCYPNAFVYSIEANSSCEEKLKELTSDYSIALLCKDDREYEFYKLKQDPFCTGNSIYRELTDHFNLDQNIEKENIKAKTLDSFNFDCFDLIKIDTQGSEIDIMIGGISLCACAKGILLEVSLNEYNHKAPLKEEVNKFMRSINFVPFEILDHNHYVNQQDILYLNLNYIVPLLR